MEKTIRSNAGFTLIEVLVVVVIIGLLSNMAIVNYGQKTKEAKNVVSEGNVVNIMTAIELYKMEKGYYPADDVEDPLAILLGGEGSTKFLKIKEDDLALYEYILSDDKKSYTINIKES